MVAFLAELLFCRCCCCCHEATTNSGQSGNEWIGSVWIGSTDDDRFAGRRTSAESTRNKFSMGLMNDSFWTLWEKAAAISVFSVYFGYMGIVHWL